MHLLRRLAIPTLVGGIVYAIGYGLVGAFGFPSGDLAEIRLYGMLCGLVGALGASVFHVAWWFAAALSTERERRRQLPDRS